MWRWVHYSEVSDIEICVGVWGGHLECQKSLGGGDWKSVSEFCLLQLEGLYVVADERFKTSAWNEN